MLHVCIVHADGHHVTSYMTVHVHVHFRSLGKWIYLKYYMNTRNIYMYMYDS